jgi:predicted GNAT family acetyltransferase
MIRIAFERENRRSAAYDGEAVIGVCEFEEENWVWTITHTRVQPEYGGRGIARQLVESVRDHAAEEKAELQSTCSYATKVLGL